MPELSRSRTAIFLQDACYQHRFIRSTDLSLIVERPERYPDLPSRQGHQIVC